MSCPRRRRRRSRPESWSKRTNRGIFRSSSGVITPTSRTTVVPRGYLTVLEGRAVSPEISSEVSGRLELATMDHRPRASAHLASHREPDLGLALRNEGIVATPSNFGLRGERPTHPELLDWLATRFVEHDWSMKDLHRLLMNSSAYRLSGRPDPHAVAADPGTTFDGEEPLVVSRPNWSGMRFSKLVARWIEPSVGAFSGRGTSDT